MGIQETLVSTCWQEKAFTLLRYHQAQSIKHKTQLPMSTVTLVKKQAEFVLKNPLLRQLMVPAAKVFTNLSGYRNLGLKLDDLLIEETPAMQKAISRLPAEESYARNYRIIAAHQLAVSIDVLPDSRALQAKDDTPYLTPYILEAEAEIAEKEALNNSTVAWT